MSTMPPAERGEARLVQLARQQVDRPRRTSHLAFAFVLFGILSPCCRSPSNASPPETTVYDNPDNMVELSRAKPIPALQLDSSCRQDADCTPAPSCCPTPCTPEVINLKDLPKARERLADCAKSPICPVAGACRTFAYLCVRQKCALVFDGDADYHQRRNP